jgi:FAD/FMN-containing dehydrogenase
MVDEKYLTDASAFKGWAECVIVARSEDEVVETLREAVRTETPVTVSGAHTGLTGSAVPQGGWVISLERFKKLEIEKGFARVGPGVSLLELRDAAAKTGQFYAPDPTEITASMGGTIATNASGSRSFMFGATRRHVLALRVATMDGQVRWYRRGEAINFDVPKLRMPDVRKTTAGYRLSPGMDWVDLFCGSEGTLGVVLEAEVVLLPIPEDIFSGVIFFASDDDALNAVEKWRNVSELRMLEYADVDALDMLRVRYPEIPKQAKAALLMEAEGDDVEGWEQRLTESHALVEASWFALDAKDRERFRAFRHAMPELIIDTMRKRGFLNMGTDYAVPIAREREMMAFYRERLTKEMPGSSMIYGHIGDAHLHVNMLPRTEEEAVKSAALVKEFAAKAAELGGTVSAEHGLGRRKAGLLKLQYSEEEIETMKAVKRRLDPLWLLGRGTLFGEGAL